MLRLALPTLAQQMLSTLVLLSDTLLTGQYLKDPAYLAAMNLMAYVVPMFICLFIVVDVGATALVARFVGAKEWDQARQGMQPGNIAWDNLRCAGRRRGIRILPAAGS